MSEATWSTSTRSARGVAGGVVPVAAQVGVEPVGVGLEGGDELGDHLALAGVQGHPLGGVHDVVGGDRLEHRALGACLAGHDEPAAVAGQRPGAVLGAGGLLDGDDEPADERARSCP